MKYLNPIKLIAVCAAITLTSHVAVAQTTNSSSVPATVETTGNRLDRRDDRPNYSWLGLLGLLGLAGLMKKRHEDRDRDRVLATPRQA